MPAIDIIDPAGNNYRYELPEDGSVLLIGSAEDCSISLPHITDLLPQHCTIALQDEGYVISVATPGATLLAEGQPTEAVVLVPRVVYNIGTSIIMFDDGTVTATEESPDTPAAETPASQKKKKKKKKKVSGSPLGASISYTEEDSVLHIIFRRLYVIFILAAFFLAGLTLRYWMMTGEFLIDELLK